MLEFDVLKRLGIENDSSKIDCEKSFSYFDSNTNNLITELYLKKDYFRCEVCNSQFIRIQKELTLKGNIVISVGLFGHSGDNEVWENMDEGTITKTKEMLDDMHKRKIDMADEIFVINVDGYIGERTKSEIEYAKAVGKNISYLENIKII